LMFPQQQGLSTGSRPVRSRRILQTADPTVELLQ
jgi:hypothetical protein